MDNNLKKLLAGQTFSVMGTSVTEKALPILLLNMSGGTTLAGSVRAIATVPTLFLTPIVGVWAETAQPRALVWLNVMFAVASVVLVIGVNDKSVWLITTALVLAQVVGTAFNPVYNRVLVALTPQGEEARVGQVQSIFARLASASGEGVAPTLARLFGGRAFFFDAGSFVLSGIIALSLPALPAEARVGGSVRARLRQFAIDFQDGWGAVSLGLLAVLVAAFGTWMSEATVLPALAAAKPILGWVFATKSLVEFATALTMLRLRWRYTNRLLGWAGMILGVSSLVLASSSYFGSWAAVLGAILSGIGSNAIGIGVNNRLFYGDRSATARVSAIVMVASKVAEIAALLVTTRVADTINPAASFLGSGALMIVTTIVVFGYVRPPMNEDS
jgi:MFS family permease